MAGGKPFSRLQADRFLAHNSIVIAGTMSAGLLGVVFQSLVSHRLRPAEYGAIFAVMTLITLIGLPASALTLITAREASRDLADGRANSGTLLVAGNRFALLGGLAVAVGIAAASLWLGPLLNLSAKLLLAAAAGLPFALALPLYLGQLLGKQRFAAFAFVSAGQAALKLAGALIFGSVLGAFGVLIGISLGSAGIYLAATFLVRSELRGGAPPRWRSVFSYLAIILPSTVALAVLFGADILLVKHYFAARPAGEYAAVSALGRAIFWGASAVAGVLFPKLIFQEVRGRNGSQLVIASLLLALAGGVLGLIVLSFSASLILTVFAGPAYANAGGYLPWYAFGMTMLGAASVLISTQQSRARANFLWVLIPVTCLEPLLIVGFHHSLLQVVQMLDTSMGVLLVGLAGVFVFDEIARRGGARRSAASQSSPERNRGHLQALAAGDATGAVLDY